ncbi:uncharacterized protein LOC110816567 isoform X3 [Carica papaya]|uniref:uncharacterized protein LOC110816567 isoform X3 n=1 Tax=Carica papaya TaxID=3649 RepID=UPI000B8CEB39|nr:uncharacterized protein LOC110816567 isoform X3 [Carica papaya]
MATNEVGSQMKNEESPGNAAAGADLDLEAGQSDKRAEEGDSTGGTPNPALVAVVVSNPGPEKLLNAVNSGKEELELPDVASPKKGCLPRTSSSHEQCRVCQQEKEEVLIDLGCQCRGGLAKAHRSCIDTWFRTKGSNQCEICQSVAANVPPPESQSTACFSPLWVAFSILIGGLLLDVLISVTLGVSALPVNIIIGVIVVLGLGTALRLSLEFCHEWSLRRVVQRVETNVHIAYHPGL